MSEELVNSIRDAVSVINDPHMGISIVEMGIVANTCVIHCIIGFSHWGVVAICSNGA